jgi:hypothetical protein
MPKVQKDPMKLHPVVSCINSFSSIFSNWLDYRMKGLIHLIPMYIRDLKALLEEINKLQIPTGAKIFTANATSIYTNIDTNLGILTLQNLFTLYSDKDPINFPKEFFLQTLEIIMKNNIFSFGDTHWTQLKGTAMGTPAAPLYFIFTFEVHENTNILNTFSKNIVYYTIFIDDIFCIWTVNSIES